MTKSLHVFIWIILSARLLGQPFIAHAEETLYEETQVKAVFMINFLDFVDWPTSHTEPTLCVVNDDVMGATLAVIRANPKAKHFAVAKKSSNSNFDACTILYVSSASQEEVNKVLLITERLPILTVSDIPRFIDRGGMIGLITREGKIKLEANTKAALDHNLHISSKLLTLAERVIQ